MINVNMRTAHIGVPKSINFYIEKKILTQRVRTYITLTYEQYRTYMDIYVYIQLSLKYFVEFSI